MEISHREALFSQTTRNDRLSPEDDELQVLRHKWSTLDMHGSKTASSVDVQVQKWSMQRARLEEEIVRRQEASRFAAPSAHSATDGSGGGGTTAMQVDAGYLSPYAALVSDPIGLEQDGGTAKMPGLKLPPSVTATARAVRTAAGEEHSRDIARIGQRVHAHGLEGVLRGGPTDHALSPVPDKPFLECLAKLPRPGDMLPSRGDSAKRTGSGKNRKKRAGSPSKRK